MKLIENQTFDLERSLYASDGVEIRNCRFAGPADGESVLKESRNLLVSDSYFDLRYPFWHDINVVVRNCELTPACRAAVWYAEGMSFENCKLHGIKAVRECNDISLEGCDVISPEFGWMNKNIKVKNCDIQSEYAFMNTSRMEIEDLRLKGKYSFQYTDAIVIRNSVLDTKDAFWHSNNVVVTDSIIKGEYLAWFSKNLHLIRCHISGTQPLCYAEGLVLEDCTMDESCDLSFEYSDVRATVTGNVTSVKNPTHGTIDVSSIGEVILDENQRPGADAVIKDLDNRRMWIAGIR